MDNKVNFLIIVPTYNSYKKLEQLVKSLKSQIYKNWKVIFIDAPSNDNHKNPFSSNIDLYGNTGGSLSSTTYTVPIRNADGMFLDSSDNELYVIIRYKGDPSPVTSITLAFS